MSDGSSKYEIILTAADKTREAFDSVKNSTKSLREDLNIMGGAFAGAAVAAASALAVMIKHSVDAADAMNKAAQKTGTTVESLSALKYAAELSDVSFESLQKNLAKLASNAYIAATSGGEAASTFKTLGINVKNTGGNLKDSGELLSELSAKFAAMPDSAEKSALAIKLFGKAGMEMIPLLNSGSDGLESMRVEAEKFGLVISTDAARRAEEMNDNLTRLHKASEGFANNIMADLLPGLAKTAEAMVVLSKEGHPVLALFRGFAGLGQGFWDFLIPPENLKKALAPDGMIDGLTKQLKTLQHEKQSIEGAGWGLVNTAKIDREITILQNQIETIKRHRAELEIKKPERDGGTRPALVDEDSKRAMDAMLANAQKFADELVTSHQSAFDKTIAKYVAMEEELTKAGSAGVEARKNIHQAFEVFLTEESDKRTAQIVADQEKELLANNKLIEAQQEKFMKMREQAEQATVFGQERENIRYAAQVRELERDRQVLEDKHLWNLETEKKYQAAMEALKKQHQAKQMQSDIAMVNFGRMIKMGEYTDAMSMAAKMTAGIASHSRAAFEINKVASIASAIMNTYKGISGVLAEFPGPAGWAMSAAQAAIGFVQVDMIAGTQFGGGGANTGGAGIPSMSTAPGIPVAPQPSAPVPVAGVAAQETRTVNISMSGEAHLYTAQSIREQLIPALNEAVGDGVVINVGYA